MLVTEKATKEASPKKRAERSKAGRKPTSPPTLPPLSLDEGKSIERQAYDALRYALMTGAIMPGQMLTSRSLSAALDVSPTPIMVALKRLEADRALESKKKSAFYVKDPNQKEFREILDIRLNLELFAIRTAARNVTANDIRLLRKLNDGYELYLNDPEGSKKALAQNFRFHFEIYKLSRSQTLVEMIETLWLRIGPALHRYIGKAGHMAIPNLHADILDALERNDTNAAADALRKDLEDAFSEMIVLLPE